MPIEISHVTFSLGSLMLIVTLCAVAAAITAQLPGLGVLFIAVAAVAFTRTVQGANRSRAAGAACGVTEKIAMFLQSLAIVSLLFLLSGAAFVATCFPLGMAMFQIDFGYGFPFAFAIGLAAGGFVLYKLGRMTWPFRD